MTKKPTLKKTRCVLCRELAASTVLGRCPSCTRIDSGTAGDWLIESVLTRSFRRHDRTQLDLIVRLRNGTWLVTAYLGVDNEIPGCRIAQCAALGTALSAAEQFGRRWLEGAPGTSLSTYVARPTEYTG